MGELKPVFFGFLKCAFLYFAFLAMCFCLNNSANAQSVILSIPASDPVGEGFHVRAVHPVSGKTNVPHKGVDIRSPVGTVLTPGGSVTCDYQGGGAGHYATVSHGCCVEEVWMHLENCSPTNITTDTTGGVTGPHLHWGVKVKGVYVDPMFAIGKDLCNGATQDAVIQDAYTKIPASMLGGGGGSTSACTAPQPPQQPTNTYQYVPPVTNPVTGSPITPAYSIVTTPDGRTYTQVIPNLTQPGLDLPPTITTGFSQPVATNNEVTGCATDTWNAMVNQSVLETRREMMVSQTLIAKPDSILAYSCIEEALKHSGEFVGPIFSESKNWANKNIDLQGGTFIAHVDMGSGSLDGALYNSANAVIESFLGSFFNYYWLGETANNVPAPSTSPIANSDADFFSIQSKADCETMAQVWQMAKCSNKTDIPGFPRFQDMIGNDTRQYPALYACNDSGITQDMIDTAKGKYTRYDEIDAHYDLLSPPGGGCYDPIPTGVTVERNQGSGIIANLLNYPDALCISPGCSYQGYGPVGNCSVKVP